MTTLGELVDAQMLEAGRDYGIAYHDRGPADALTRRAMGRLLEAAARSGFRVRLKGATGWAKDAEEKCDRHRAARLAFLATLDDEPEADTPVVVG